MSLSVEQVRQMREQIKANDAAKTAAQKKTTTQTAKKTMTAPLAKNSQRANIVGTTAQKKTMTTQTAKTTPAAPAAKSAGTGLSVAQVAQIRSQMTAAPASTSRLQTTASTPAWTGGTRQVLGTVSADTLGKQVLADMASNTGSPVATDRQEDYEPGWNYVGSDNAPKQRAIAQGTYGSYAKAAQKVGNALAKDRQTDRFDELNQWMDADPRHREVVDLLRQKEYTTQEDKGVAPEQAVQVTGTKQRYSPGDLLKMGYTAQEINEARAYIREYDALPVTDRAVRRTADTTKGIAATVASAVPMAGEMTTQGAKDIRATQKNEAALDKELEGDARGKELKDRITAVDMDYNPQYTDEDLRGMGYSQSEIDEMRSRIAGTVQKTALDKDTSLGYQLYHYGQQRTEAAQAGMSPAAKTAMGVATSAAENLAVAGVSPYLVLPVLSAQGAAESMGQDVEKGTSAGQAVGVGLAKFGAGWAINSVGVADMARSMGVDYARDTVAGKLADLVRSSKLVSGLGNSQLAANTISGGVDNAVQAFVETYADKIIDATLGGDQQAADELLQSDTFLQALQSGLTGGASGALGGAVGTGLGAMSRTLDARAGTETAAPVQADTESRAADAAAAQRALEARAMEPGEAARQQADQAAAVQQTDNADAAETTAQKDAAPAVRSENPAVQQLAAAMEADALTGKTINLFTPNAANKANRAAFAEEYGMELPATASETRKALRTLAQQTQQQAAEAPDTNVGNNAARAENPAADPGQGAVEKAGETVESGQGYSVSMSNDTMTVRFADGTEAVRTVDPENPRTMLFDPEQLHRQAQAESRAEVQKEAQETTQQSREAPDGLRRTVGLRQQTLTEKQRAVQRTLTDWKVSEGAAETISRMVPDSVADLEHYTAAASSMYRMGQMDGVKTFGKALELAGGMNNLAPNTNYVLQQPGGEQALRAAFLQGQGEVEAGAVERGALGGALTDQSTKGEGRVIWKGSDRAADDVAAQVIRLNAAGTGTDAILKSVLLGPDGSPSERVKAYVDTETGRIFFGDRNGDVFGTVLHEDYHWYNALDAEGAKAVQNTALEYLAKSEGFENVDELIRDKVKDYAAQGLTYEQAAEELVADSWRGIFDSAESVTRWAEFQRAQAEKNAGKAGTIHKVMTAVKEMLNGIISRAKEALTLDPENRAALKAQRLAEAEKRALQDAYFAHAEKAMDNLRAAKENAAALKSEGAAQGVRFQLHEGKDSLVEQMNGHLDELEEMKPVATIEGTEVSFGKTRNENISNVEEFFDSIGNKVIRENFGTVELTKSGARATVQHGNSKAKQVAVAAVPEVIQKGKQIGYEQNWQGRGYDTYVFAAPVEIDGTKLYEGVIVREYTRQNGMKNFYVHEVCWTDGSYVTFDTEGNMTKKEDTPTQLPKAVRSTLADAQEVSSDTTIAQTSAKSKENNAAVQKNVRYQLAEQDELAKLHTEQQQLTKQRSALKEERSAWLNSAEVQRIEAKKKALGVFSAEGKAYRDSAEYQDYLAKRKEYNSRLAALEERDSALTEQMKAANERLQQRKDAQAKDAQRAYDAKAKEYGGNAEYRRVLAKEQFGVTEEFRRAGYILPDGQMLDFAQNDRSRDTDHREILEVFGPAEVKNGTEALNEFLLDGNVRVMAEAPGVDISADTAPTAQQLEQIRKMAEQLGGERRQFTLDISTADGRVAASKEYSGRVDADKVVREIREYYKTGELAQESSLAKFRFQLAEQASREAKKNDQRQASRDIANTAAALDTLSQFFGVTRGVKVSQDSLDGLAARWTKANASRADRAKLANETRVLVDYLKADGADMTKAQALAETLAGEVLDGATYRNSELWDEYPELHRLEYTVNKTGKAKAELVKRYGNWSAAVAEARSHGVALRQADGVRDGNPAEQYESIVNDTRAVGGIQDGARALWKAAAQQAGVEGVMSMESTEWLDVLMNLHDSIKPEMRSRFADEAEYEDARVELAGRMIEDIMNVPEMTDAQAIFEGMQKQALQMAKAAAGDEARAAEVEKGMQGVQKVQRQEFARRLAANQRTETRSAVKIDGKTFTNLGDVNEYITYQREEFRRQLKQQEQRLKAQRQEDMDAAKLWYKERMGELREEDDYLADQVKQEQRRADRAERSLMIQDNEIMEWEAENERRREAWQQKQAQRNAIALEVARQQRDEDIAIAKKVAENRVQRARDARKADELKRSIRANAAQLNQMVLRPQKGKYVQKGLIVEAAEVAKLANLVTLNSKAVNQLTRLQDSITASMGSEGAPNAMTEDWKQSKVPELIQTLREDLTAAKNARLDKLHEQLAQAEALPDSEKARALQDRLKARIRDTENRVSLPMTVDQLRLLKAITSSTLHVIRTENKTLSLAKAEEVSAIADAAAYEVKTSKGNRPGGRFDGLRNTLTKYQLDMLGGERVFRMLGGYAKNGQMEKLARMLNNGQRRQSEITIKGEKLFADVTGKTHLKEMDAFAGPGAETVDIGLTDTKGNSVPLNHAMLCSLYMHLQNADSRQHLLNGGLTVPSMEQYTKGNIERAYQEGQTVHLGGLQNADGTPMVDTVLQTVENALTDYDRAWIADMQELFNRYTTNLINETSMQLLGYNRAGVKNYYPIAVDKSALATQIEGLNLDATIEGRGFLKNRVKKAVQPILLEECSNVVQRSIRDTAAYAGLALPIRDVQKVLNSNVETKDGVYNLKNGIIKEQWGRSAVEYINDLLTDLQTTQRKRDNGVSRMAARLRGNYAGAILTLNPGVAIAQAASLPTAAAVLGSDTMASVVPFVKNFSTKQRAALETEISEHGDVLLEWRKRGSQRGELASIGKGLTPAEKAMDKLPKALTGWINGVDEVTVAALWEGSKAYVKNHPGEFAEGAAKEGSEDYWQAVNRMYQKVIEQTQPNYTVMQRAGIQRNPDEFVKTFTMFTTQRFQNYGILADAVMDYNAQKARFEEGETEETKAELQRAGKQLQRAAGSQVAQTAVFALMKIGADFLLHRWDREQDENGDVTLKSLLSRFTGLFTESAAGNFLFGSEVYSLVDNALNGKDYDVVSATNISAVNDLAGDVTKFVSELRKDTADMDETKLATHHGKVEKYALTLMEDGLEIAGVPFGNGRKILEAFKGYVQDAVNMFHGGKFTFSSLPASATGQYDRLYDAYASGDAGEAQAAMEKLDGMVETGKIKENKMYEQMKKRLKQYEPRVTEAARETNAENWEKRKELIDQMTREMKETFGTDSTDVRDTVVKAVDEMSNELRLTERGHDKNDSIYVDLRTAVSSGSSQDLQDEYDRLVKAGKKPDTVKTEITKAAKPDYVDGSDYDREQMAEMLLALTDRDGNALYEQKNLGDWMKQAEKNAEKEAQKENEVDRYDLLK